MQLIPYTANDFNDYFQLVKQEKIMYYITGHALDESQTQAKFKGVIDYNEIHSDSGHYKVYHDEHYVGYGKVIVQDDGRAEIGYMLFPEYWGIGIGSLLVNALIEHAKALKQYTTLFGIIDPENQASKNLLSKYGFQSVWIGDYRGLPGEILELKIQ